MSPALRRIIAVQAHLTTTGHLAKTVHALGTGETFSFSLTRDGFRDDTSGLEASLDRGFFVDGQPIILTPRDNVMFDGEAGGVQFSGRAGGGTSVTLYIADDWFQYAIAP